MTSKEEHDKLIADEVDAASQAVDDADGADDESVTDGNGNESERRPKQADILIGLAGAAKLFHTPAPDSDAYADLTIDGHRETHRIRGKGFREWLRYQYFKKVGSGCNSDAMHIAIETIAAKARYEGEEHKVFVRVAEYCGAIYIDLGDPEWQSIKVTASGWRIIDNVPVRFVRQTSTKALPVPKPGGSIELFRPFCNLKKPKRGHADNEFVVLVGHILAAMRPNASYPVFAAMGEHGSCKSTLSSIIKKLVDPRSPEQRSPPTKEDDLIIAAKGAHVLAYDNISSIPDWLSDAFCRLSTGGGAGKRRLYTDDDEVLFDGRRPIFLTGIEDFITRPDLVDRSNIFNLEVVKETDRLSDAEVEQKFESNAPHILGALLDGLVSGLKHLPSIKITEKPRMADFALWGEACTRAYWDKGTFLKAYRANMEASVEVVIEASAVGTAVRRFMNQRKDKWDGAAQELLTELTRLIGERAAKEREWPKRPNILSGKLKRAAPALRKIGINVTFDREGHVGERKVIIEKRAVPGQRPEQSSAPSASSAKKEASNKISYLSVTGADGVLTGADDNGWFADGLLTIDRDAIVSTKSLKNNGADGADDADDVFPLPSEKAFNRVCAQCGAGPLTDPPSDPPTKRVKDGDAVVWLHTGPCHRVWMRKRAADKNQTSSF